MSGRFAGSKSLDERRRRRLAADETHQKIGDGSSVPTDAERPLPARRPTGRFPLRRLVSSSLWKLTACGLAALTLAGLTVAGTYHPAVQAGLLGPGVAELFAAGAVGPISSVAGLLLLAAAQLAWLIRWARARSLRDFRGRYRIWWWTSLATGLVGLSLLTDAHFAAAETAVWLIDGRMAGTELSFLMLAGGAMMLFLLPSLQRDMRGCRTSRTLLLLAVGCWMLGGTALLLETQLTPLLTRLGAVFPAVAVASSLLLLGTVAHLTGLLFHARHVIYESVEPPEIPVRKKVVATASLEEESSNETAVKSGPRGRRSTTRRQAKAAATKKSAGEADEKMSNKAASASTKPAESSNKTTEAKPQPAAAAVDAIAETVAKKSEPAKPSRPVESTPEYLEETDDASSDDEDAMVSYKGRNLRLDGPEDSLKGLSKRERRKLRKAMKERERAEA